MQRIIICDDEPQIGKEYKIKIIKLCEEMSIQTEVLLFYSAVEMLDCIKKKPADILFLDIDMPEMDGLQAAEQMGKSDCIPLLIFVTHQDTMVFRSFRYHPFSFIRKNYFEDEIEEVLQSAIEKLTKDGRVYVFRNGTETVKVKLRQILYFESEGNYVNLYTTEGTFRYRETLGGIENQLKDNGFIRIHKGFLVNSEAVFQMRSGEVILSDRSVLPIGRTNREAVRAKLKKYMMK